MARKEAALSKLTAKTMENDWPEVQRLAKKYFRHREIEEGLSCSLDALVSFTLARERLLEKIPFEYPLDQEDSKNLIRLPEELLKEVREQIKPCLKKSLKALKSGNLNNDERVVLIMEGLISLYSPPIESSEGEDNSHLRAKIDFEPLSAKETIMKPLFDLFQWISVFIAGFDQVSYFEIIVNSFETMIESEPIHSSKIFHDLYLESLFRFSLFQASNGQFVQGTNGLRKFLKETRTKPNNPARLVAIRALLRLLEERFSDSTYRKELHEYIMNDSSFQPSSRFEEISLLCLIYSQEFTERSPLEKDRVQTGWSHLKSIVAGRLARIFAWDSLESIYEMGFEKFATNHTFYDELLGIYLKQNKRWEAFAVATSIAEKSISAQTFLLQFPSQHDKLKSLCSIEIKNRIEIYQTLSKKGFHKDFQHSNINDPFIRGIIFYKQGRAEEAVINLKKALIADPYDIRVTRVLFYILSKDEADNSLWQLIDFSTCMDPFIIKTAIECAYLRGNLEKLNEICQTLTSAVETEIAPISLKLSQSDPLMKGSAFTEGDAASILGVRSTSLGEYSIGYQSETHLPPLPVIQSKYPTFEEWKDHFIPLSSMEYRALKLFNYMRLSIEDWSPLSPLELLGKFNDDPRILLAHALVRLNRMEEASSILQELLKQDELIPVAQLLFAMIYEMMGDREMALEWLERFKLLSLINFSTDFEKEIGEYLERELVKNIITS
jgi:tetratricopeptide (TPR) repeat protein